MTNANPQSNRILHHRHQWALLLIILLGFSLRLSGLGQQSLWFDDIITVHLARLPLIDGLDGLIGQGIQLTPLYHWVTKLWLMVGDTEWLLRFPAVCFSVLTIPLIFGLGTVYVNRQIGLLMALIFALNPYQLWYAHEVKVYSLLTVSAIGAMITFQRLLKGAGKQNTSLFIIFNMLGFGSHYFMFLLPTVQFIFLLRHFKRYYAHLKQWVIVHIVSSAILWPWLGYIFYRNQFTFGVGWIPTPTLMDPLLTIWNFTLGYQENASQFVIIPLLIITFLLIAGVSKITTYTPFGELLLIWAFFPLIVVWLFSQGIASFYVDRYFLIITPVITMMLVVGSMRWPKPRLRVGLSLALVLITTYGVSQVRFDHTHFTRDDWRGLAQILHQEAQPGDGLVTCTDGFRLALNHYNPGDLFAQQAQANELYFVYPANFDFNVVLKKYQRLWVTVSNPRHPQHHLGFSYPVTLAVDRLSSMAQAWLAQYPPQVRTVAGLTAFLYSLSEMPDLNALIPWTCQTEAPN